MAIYWIFGLVLVAVIALVIVWFVIVPVTSAPSRYSFVTAPSFVVAT